MLRLYLAVRLAQRLLQVLQICFFPILGELLKTNIGERMMEHHLENLEWHGSNVRSC